jgi:hypothetical protein
MHYLITIASLYLLAKTIDHSIKLYDTLSQRYQQYRQHRKLLSTLHPEVTPDDVINTPMVSATFPNAMLAEILSNDDDGEDMPYLASVVGDNFFYDDDDDDD